MQTFRTFVIFALLVASGAISLTQSTPLLIQPKEQTPSITTTQKGDQAIILRVIDGDTITVSLKDSEEKIRLIGVNTPESVDPRRPVECFGKEASRFTKELLPQGSTVYLVADLTQTDRDKYGRLLRYVLLPDGTLMNELIIASGYGHEYTYRTPYEHQTAFKAAEHSAREEQKGLWASSACNLPNS